MKNQLRIQNLVSSAFITTAAAGAIVASPSAFAQDEDKEQLTASQLFVDASDAASKKQYDVAVEKYKELLKLDPDNEEAKERLAEAEKALHDTALSDSGAAGAPENSFEKIVRHRKAVYREMDAALLEARHVAVTEPDKALRLLDEIQSALPKTPASRPYFDSVALVRQEALLVLSQRQRGEEGESLEDEALVKERNEIRENVLSAKRLLAAGEEARAKHELDEADELLERAEGVLPKLSSTNDLLNEIREEKALVWAVRFFDAVGGRNSAGARISMTEVDKLLGKDHKIYKQLDSFYKEWKKTAAFHRPEGLNVVGVNAAERCTEELVKGKSQYMYGDYQGALESYRKALLYQPDNAEAKSMQVRIRKILANSGEYNHELTREMMMADVREKWNLAMPFTAVSLGVQEKEEMTPEEERMSQIRFSVAFRDVPLGSALEKISELSSVYDPSGDGFNFSLKLSDGKSAPIINIQLNKAMPMDELLKTVLGNVGYRYDVLENGVVQVTEDIGDTGLDLREFTVSPKVVARMAGPRGTSGGGSESVFGSSGEEATEEKPEEEGIKNFFKRVGVSWEGDRSLVYDATSNLLIVTQDRRNLDRIQSILRSLSTAETQQVNIEAKFIEVNSTVLNQVVTNWSLTRGEGNEMFTRASTNNRTVAGAHATVSESSLTEIYTPPKAAYTDEDGVEHEEVPASTYTVAQPPPQVTRQPNYGVDALPTFTGVIGTVGNYDLRLILNALSANDGTDLMAAPSLTVQSEMEATIKIVQLLRWPQSYDDMEISVSGNNNNNDDDNNRGGYGNASVGITPGTPQFDEEATEVGIQMRVLPRVNKDDKSITLELSPEIKEFEGFIEYGGTAVAIAGGIVVTTPAGFFQPVFNLRQVSTTVEVYDGGTIVIGGLTREEIRTVNDKVPVLGDLPLIGSAFRSTGKSITKKNLLIFVTANLMARGGGTEAGGFKNIQPGSTYSNPSLFIPSGPVYREYDTSSIEDADKAKAGSSDAQ